MKKQKQKKSAQGKQLAILGCGELGGAILKGILEARLFSRDQILLCDRNQERLTDLNEALSIDTTADPKKAYQSAPTVILAVKPQDLKPLLTGLGRSGSGLVISVAAGCATQTIRQALGPKVEIVRVIPNISAAVGLSLNAVFSESDRGFEQATDIFQSIGRSIRIANESNLAIASALSASGVALLYTAAQGMIDGGVLMGLSREESRVIVMQTMLGSGALGIEEGIELEALQERVATPGGTTVQGLLALEQGAVRAHFAEAIKRATLKMWERE